MKHLIYIIILLGVVASASAQDSPFPDTDSLKRYISQVIRNSAGVIDTRDMRLNKGGSGKLVTDTVMLKIILSNKTSVHFYRKGLKRGDQYWYFDGRRIKKLPVNWFVWETRPIKQ